jgi:Tfp pilus assembly protein PilX
MIGQRKRETNQSAHRLDGQSGMALLLALLIIVSLTAFSLSLVLFTQSEIRLSNTVASQSQAYYAAVAGLEEARGRLNPTAVDALAILPQQVNQVLYLLNSSTQDPVQPTNLSSSYYDYEYSQEFPGGFGAAQMLTSVASDQPGAGTSYVIPYKWVRITLKTEYASQTDVNQDGILNSSIPINWDGAHQDLSTNMPSGIPVYMLTSLAVEPNGIRKVVQEEVAGTPPLIPVAGVGTAGSVTLTGTSPSGGGTGSPNLTLSGMDACKVQNIPGIAAGSTITTSGQMNILGSPSPSVQNLLPFPQIAGNIIQSLFAQAVPILYADPTHVTASSSGTSLVGTNVVLGQLPGPSNPGQPAVVYANQSLAISGSTSTGYGILLVNGNFSITGGFTYSGVIVVNGTVALTLNSTGSIQILGSLISSGNLSVDSSASPITSLNVTYDSCAITDSFQSLPMRVRSFKELSF